jgi:hypothetical protein
MRAKSEVDTPATFSFSLKKVFVPNIAYPTGV